MATAEDVRRVQPKYFISPKFERVMAVVGWCSCVFWLLYLGLHIIGAWLR